MRTVKLLVLTVLTGGMAGLGVYAASDADKPKHAIDSVMDIAHKPKKGTPSLFKRVVDGKASKEEQKQLLSLYEDLSKNKPPKGSEQDWKDRTGKMIAAARDVVDGKQGAAKALGKVVNCKACHQLHKGDD
jgi:hypothetical protein